MLELAVGNVTELQECVGACLILKGVESCAGASEGRA